MPNYSGWDIKKQGYANAYPPNNNCLKNIGTMAKAITSTHHCGSAHVVSIIAFINSAKASPFLSFPIHPWP